MSKVMTKESRVVLSGRYDQKECRARVVIPEYKLGQCVNITHWRGGDEESLEKALPGHPNLVDLVDGIVRCPGMAEGVKVGSTPDLKPEFRLVARDQKEFIAEMRCLVSAIHEHSHRLARMLGRTDPLWVGPTGEDISSDLATITVAEVGEWESRPIWVAFQATWKDMSPRRLGHLVTPAGVAG